MRLVTYRERIDSAGQLGVIEGGTVVDVESLGGVIGEPLPGSMLGLIDLGPAALNNLQSAWGYQ